MSEFEKAETTIERQVSKSTELSIDYDDEIQK